MSKCGLRQKVYRKQIYHQLGGLNEPVWPPKLLYPFILFSPHPPSLHLHHSASTPSGSFSPLLFFSEGWPPLKERELIFFHPFFPRFFYLIPLLPQPTPSQPGSIQYLHVQWAKIQADSITASQRGAGEGGICAVLKAAPSCSFT